VEVPAVRKLARKITSTAASAAHLYWEICRSAASLFAAR